MATFTHLEDILSGDATAVGHFQKELSSQGFCFVKLPSDLVTQVEGVSKAVQEFFTSPAEVKKQFCHNLLGGEALDGLVYGYNHSGAPLVRSN